MVEKSQEESPLINVDKLEKLISLYKFPLILASIGIILLFLTIILILRNQTDSSSEIEFISEATISARAKVSIDIEGAVEKPGVYMLSGESRINDALVAAGGLSAVADRQWVAKNLNRAAKLVDGGKIYIPSLEQSSSVGSKNLELGTRNTQGDNLLGITANQININSALSSQLESIKGIGPVTAQKIIDGRPYQSVEELRTRNILGQSLYEKSKDLLTVY